MSKAISGHGQLSEVPETANKWNWGGFWLTWLWGVFNETPRALLGLIPIVNFYAMYDMGKNGSKLAWQNKKWKSEEKYLNAQKIWAIAGWCLAPVMIGTIIFFAYNNYLLDQREEYVYETVEELIYGDADTLEFIGGDYEVLSYMRPSDYVISNEPNNLLIETDRTKYLVLVRFDDEGEISAIIVSHYYYSDRYREVLISN